MVKYINLSMKGKDKECGDDPDSCFMFELFKPFNACDYPAVLIPNWQALQQTVCDVCQLLN